MSNQTVLTIVGNLTADPELRFTADGHWGGQVSGGFDPASLRPWQSGGVG